MNVAVGPRADQSPVAAIGDDLLGGSAAQDTLGQSTQAFDDGRIVGTATIPDDGGLRTALLGVPHVLGQLQVGDDTAVGPLLFALAQICVLS